MSPTDSPKQTPWTPGPWQLGARNGDYIDIDAPTHSGLASVVWQMEDDRLCDEPSPAQEANAHLIVAAPELYEACDAWIRWLDPETEFSEDDAEIEREILDRMKAALSKARPSNKGEG